MPREQEIPSDTVTCLRCGWVSYAVTKANAEAHVAKHNAMREAEPQAMKWWPTPATIETYRCRGCGQWGPYRKARQGDCPTGATINPVVCEHV